MQPRFDAWSALAILRERLCGYAGDEKCGGLGESVRSAGPGGAAVYDRVW